jgi:hypothetical protein
MKNRATKERRREREEVVYMLRDEIERLRGLPAYKSKKAIDEFVEKKVRPLLPYNRKTNNCDIFCSLNRTYHQVFNIKY